MMLRTPDDVKQLGNILCLGAHPDDETFLAGGILAQAHQNGQETTCVTATRGEQGVQDESRWPQSKLSTIRTAEMAKAMDILGVTYHYWLDYTDGECDKADRDVAAGQLTALLEKHQPDTVLTFGPEGMTGHADHATMPCWLDMALEQSNYQPQVFWAVVDKQSYNDYLVELDKALNMFFNIKKPPIKKRKDCQICICHTEETVRSKMSALQAMESQTTGLFQRFDPQLILNAWKCECFVKAHKLDKKQ